MAVNQLLYVVFTLHFVAGKIYEKCELAQELVNKHNFPKDGIENWLCLVEHESGYSTSAIGTLNADGSKDHGLFQISDLWWCQEPGGSTRNGCNMPCSAFQDNSIKDDVKCVKKIFQETERLGRSGFSAWVAWNNYCQGDLSKYKGCFEGIRPSIPGSGWSVAVPTSPPVTDDPDYEAGSSEGDNGDNCSDQWENSVEFPRAGCGRPAAPPRFPPKPPVRYPSRPDYRPLLPADDDGDRTTGTQPTQSFFCSGNTMECEWVPGANTFPYRCRWK